MKSCALVNYSTKEATFSNTSTASSLISFIGSRECRGSKTTRPTSPSIGVDAGAIDPDKGVDVVGHAVGSAVKSLVSNLLLPEFEVSWVGSGVFASASGRVITEVHKFRIIPLKIPQM